MRKKVFKNTLKVAAVIICLFAPNVLSQTDRITGTVLSYGTGRSLRTVTTNLTLTLNGTTSDSEATNLIAILRADGQDAVLKAIRKAPERGRLQLGSRLAEPVAVVRRNEVDGKQRIFCVLERDLNFAEIRFGSRSTDYPFSVIEIFIDPETGKGEGTYIAAARVRIKENKKDGTEQLEIEDFGTYPARLMGVRLHYRKM